MDRILIARLRLHSMQRVKNASSNKQTKLSRNVPAPLATGRLARRRKPPPRSTIKTCQSLSLESQTNKNTNFYFITTLYEQETHQEMR